LYTARNENYELRRAEYFYSSNLHFAEAVLLSRDRLW